MKTLNILKTREENNLKKLSKEWLENNKNSFKKSTHQSYAYIVDKYLLPTELSLISINELDINDFVLFTNSLLSKGLSAKMINDILIVINQLIKYSSNKYDTKLISLPYVKETKKEMRVLSRSEQQILEKHLKNDIDIYKFGTLISLYTGIRIGELCALQWGDICNGTIKIYKTMYRLKDENGCSKVVIETPKTNSSNRTIPIPLFLNYIIESHRSQDDDYILSNSKLAYVEPRLMQMNFKKIVNECNLEKVTFHTLRHTFATRCVECGFDIKTLSEILGHSDVKTTLNKYVHSSMELKQENMNKLSQIAI